LYPDKKLVNHLSSQIAELGQVILNFTHTVPAGMIVFFPSYNFLNTAKDVWKKGGVLDKFNVKKKVSQLSLRT
jgi:chromosome transmission fidelity protein 1